MSGRLEGKVAVVTGGGNGIRRACCVRAVTRGYYTLPVVFRLGPRLADA